MPTMTIPRDRIEAVALATKPSPPEGPDLESGAILGLRIASSGEIVSLIGRESYTLGRAIAGQAVVPDVDLEPYNAYEHGVSRMHAEIRLKPEGIHVVDLESANGTLINGHRLDPQAPTLVRHGDIIQLGRLRLQLISRYRG